MNNSPGGIREEGREDMIALLVKRGISDQRLLAAMRKIDRRSFVGAHFSQRAYEDSALLIGCSQTISQPYTVAVMTEFLRVKSGDKILEIGTGSGYQASVLAELGARVFTIERHIELLNEARKRFDSLGYAVVSKCGDGTIGWSEFAPFDGIIVTAGAPVAPEPLIKQLKDGGVLVVPVGDMQMQDLHVIRRSGDTYTKEEIKGFKFVPLVGKNAWKSG
jgi:protein-L-isoaspartate(D-aspartate) O-methyltransferase